MYYPDHINPIVKLTEVCNYHCDFCRYANHRQKDNGIEIGAVCSFICQCAEYNLSNGIKNMNIIFHGGEPLLYGLDRFRKIIEYEANLVALGMEISNSIQTNSSLITDDWISFFAKNNFSVGISIDGPLGLNGHIGMSAIEAQNSAISSYKALKENGVECGILSVITTKHLKYPNEFFNFLIDNDISSVGLCYCYNRIDNKNINPVSLGEFLVELYKLYYSSPKRIRIREFDMATRQILKRPRHECAMSCRESCGSFLTIRPDGYVEFCDDYDLKREGTLGSIDNLTLQQLLETITYQEIRNRAIEIINSKCEKCKVYSICRSGCMRNDSEGTNYFCETFKILYPFIEKTVNNCTKNISVR